MVEHLAFLAFLLLSAVLFAQAEIAIEGPNGWAEKLPTWRFENRWTKLFYSSRPLTGYHLSVQLFVLVILHAPYALGLSAVTLTAELRIISFMIFFWIIEDFLWFVFNPAFGIRKFKSKYIWWHQPHWWWIMPRDYWIFAPIGTLLYVWSYSR